jgi:hypothetical protein
MLAWARAVGVTFLTLTILAIGACGSARSHPAPVGAPIPQVGSVVVDMAPELPADRRARLDKLGATFLLKGALEAALSKAGKFDAQSPVVLQVDITKFRLRSGATVFWFGVMAGGDYMDVRAAAHDGDRTLRQVETGAGSIGAGGLSQDSRFATLARAVADRVTKDL